MGADMRPSFHEIFMQMAELFANRSTCNRKKVGCVLTRQNRIISVGYNGSVAGSSHCIEVGCLMEEGHCVRTIHAEVNAIMNAARLGVALNGCTAYVTTEPCFRCSLALTQVGCDGVHYADFYADPVRAQLNVLPMWRIG